MIEVYLNSEKEQMRFPVVPPSIGKNVNADISSSGIVKKGKINIFNGSEPDSVSLAHFFPSADATYSFIDVKGQDPYSYVNKLEKWCKTGERLRYIVTGTPINIQVKISHFEYKENDASGDVYYILELKEDSDIEIPEWHPPAEKSKTLKGKDEDKGMQNPTAETVLHRYGSSKKTAGITGGKYKEHTVKHGEFLYSIAQKYYGDGRKYERITKNAENIKRYPSLKKSNMIYSNWKLVIP